MKRLFKWFVAVAASVLLVGGFGAVAANAADGDDPFGGWELVLIPDTCSVDGEEVRVFHNFGSMPEGVASSSVVINGVEALDEISDVAYFMRGPGVYNYTYNTYTETVEPVTRSGSFTVTECTVSELVAPAPTQDGPNVIIPEFPGAVYINQGTDSVVSGTYVLADGETLTVYPTQTGDIPVVGGPWTFTWTAPVVDPDPVAPIVDAHLNGVLTDDNQSAVHAVVTVVHNDAEGPLTVKVSHGDVTDWTQEFPEGQTEPLRATLLVEECGDVTFTVTIEGYPESTQTYVVNVPCPATDGGDDDGGSTGPGGDNGDTDGDTNTGGDTDGDTNTGGDTDTSTGTNGGSTDTPSNTDDKKPVDDTVIKSGHYDTGDTVLGSSSSSMVGYAAGGLAGLLAILLVTMGVIRSRRATATN